MSAQSFKQSISALVYRNGWSRRLWMKMQCANGTLYGKVHAKDRSWSEHEEDAVLLELAKKCLGNGFYVDVGANLPTKRSNTFRLYCHGMKGICVEPNLELAALYERVRPRDEVVCAAIAPEAGLMSLHRFNYHVYSTCLEEEAERQQSNANPHLRTKLLRVSPVPTISLRTLLDHTRERFNGSFFLLKVDTEGFDLEVLKSNDWDTNRPSYVLTESTGEENEVRMYLFEKGYKLIRELPSKQLFNYHEEA